MTVAITCKQKLFIIFCNLSRSMWCKKHRIFNQFFAQRKNGKCPFSDVLRCYPGHYLTDYSPTILRHHIIQGESFVTVFLARASGDVGTLCHMKILHWFFACFFCLFIYLFVALLFWSPPFRVTTLFGVNLLCFQNQ